MCLDTRTVLIAAEGKTDGLSLEPEKIPSRNGMTLFGQILVREGKMKKWTLEGVAEQWRQLSEAQRIQYRADNDELKKDFKALIKSNSVFKENLSE